MFGIIGSGSWATALTKILTDKKMPVNWWIRNAGNIDFIKQRKHNPHYLSSVLFDTSLLNMSNDLTEIVRKSETLIIGIPSAYVEQSLQKLSAADLKDKKIVSAIKGLLPQKNVLLNYYLEQQFDVPLENYFAVLGPCHAEEVAAEKLSYLTISGTDITTASRIASALSNDYTRAKHPRSNPSPASSH